MPTAIASEPQAIAPGITASSGYLLRRLLFVAPFPEILLTLGFFLIAAILAWNFGLKFVPPSGNALAFTGMSYAVPLSLIAALGLFLVIKKQTIRLAYYVTVSLAYGVILITHFNVKLWMSIINPQLWDQFYWQTDEAVRPVIDASFAVHNLIGKIVPFENHLYLFAFLAMFVCSIIVHSAQRFILFRTVVFTAMLVHVLGALSYLVAPAVGPFIYEDGANALETVRQAHMYEGYQKLAADGPTWIALEGSQFLFSGIAAMPSLHVASSAVFVYYAWQNARWLCWVYVPLFSFIMIEAMATRWHYMIDLGAGLVLTGLAIAMTAALFRPIEAYHAARC